MKAREVFLLKEAISDIEDGRIFYDKKEKANHLIQMTLKLMFPPRQKTRQLGGT